MLIKTKSKNVATTNKKLLSLKVAAILSVSLKFSLSCFKEDIASSFVLYLL